MKPHQKTAQLRRKLAAAVYKQCSSPEKFEYIVRNLPDEESRRRFYHSTRPHLSFRPRPLEEIQ